MRIRNRNIARTAKSVTAAFLSTALLLFITGGSQITSAQATKRARLIRNAGWPSEVQLLHSNARSAAHNEDLRRTSKP